VYYKGYEYLLQAMKNVDAVLLLGGTGPLSDRLTQMASSLKLEDRIVFLGRVPDEELPAFYHACDLYCMPSVERSEAFGLVQVEAMACRKPVVCCELNNGVTYVNKHGITGMVVPPRDPAALASALNELLGDDRKRVMMGEAGYARAKEEFTIDRMCRDTLKLYREVLGGKTANGNRGAW
jgi:rhamnosyl/mannosyltransferase